MFDTIVIGAGPAGASTAYHLARRGYSVLVIERSPLPRYKPCTGAVSPRVADWFDFDFAPAVDHRVSRVRYTWKLADPVEGELVAEPIWQVRREMFDLFLVKQAIAQGAELLDGTAATGIAFEQTHWRVELPTGCQRGKFLVAADGAQGPTATWLGFKPPQQRQAAILEVPTAVSPEATFAFEFGLAKAGCLWCFPRPQGYALGAAAFVGRDLSQPLPLLQTYAATFGVDPAQGQCYAHPLALWTGPKPLHASRALLVGEAAALVDPLAAEGIRPALLSGMEAAAAIAQALAGDDAAIETHLARYSQTLNQTWGADMQWARRIASVFFRVPGVGYRVGIKRPSATRRLGQILAGELRYADIADRVIRRMSTGLIPGRGG